MVSCEIRSRVLVGQDCGCLGDETVGACGTRQWVLGGQDRGCLGDKTVGAWGTGLWGLRAMKMEAGPCKSGR